MQGRSARDYSGSVADQTPRTKENVIEKTREVVKEPDQWRVLLLNDDYTPMDFVVAVLESVFHKPPSEAYRVMMQVHTKGQGIAGIYAHEVAETKAAQASTWRGTLAIRSRRRSRSVRDRTHVQPRARNRSDHRASRGRRRGGTRI